MFKYRLCFLSKMMSEETENQGLDIGLEDLTELDSAESELDSDLEKSDKPKYNSHHPFADQISHILKLHCKETLSTEDAIAKTFAMHRAGYELIFSGQILKLTGIVSSADAAVLLGIEQTGFESNFYPEHKRAAGGFLYFKHSTRDRLVLLDIIGASRSSREMGKRIFSHIFHALDISESYWKKNTKVSAFFSTLNDVIYSGHDQVPTGPITPEYNAQEESPKKALRSNETYRTGIKPFLKAYLTYTQVADVWQIAWEKFTPRALRKILMEEDSEARRMMGAPNGPGIIRREDFARYIAANTSTTKEDRLFKREESLQMLARIGYSLRNDDKPYRKT